GSRPVARVWRVLFLTLRRWASMKLPAALDAPPANGKPSIVTTPQESSCGGPIPDLDATTLLRPAAVVGHRGHVRNRDDADTQRGESTHGRFTTGARTLDLDFEVLDALVLSGAACHFGGDLRGERGGLARTLEALATTRGPRQCIALAVGDRDDRVVERRVNVSNTVRNILADLLAHALRGRIGRCFSHAVSLSNWVRRRAVCLLLQRSGRLARTLAGACIRAGALTTQRQAATVAEATIATQVHQALDVDRRFATQVTFDGELAHLFADLLEIGVGQVLDLLRAVDAAAVADLLRGRATDTVDRAQTDLGVLLRRNVDASDTCHVRPLIC